LIEDVVGFDRIKRIKTATTIYKEALQKQLQISSGKSKQLMNIAPDTEGLAPGKEMEVEARAQFHQDS
jgi:hypothetical protein